MKFPRLISHIAARTLCSGNEYPARAGNAVRKRIAQNPDEGKVAHSEDGVCSTPLRQCPQANKANGGRNVGQPDSINFHKAGRSLQGGPSAGRRETQLPPRSIMSILTKERRLLDACGGWEPSKQTKATTGFSRLHVGRGRRAYPDFQDAVSAPSWDYVGNQGSQTDYSRHEQMETDQWYFLA